MRAANEILLMGKQYNLSEIQRATGISLSHLSRIASGDRVPSIAVATKIASFIGADMNEFISKVCNNRKGKKS